jgi:predicted ATPase
MRYLRLFCPTLSAPADRSGEKLPDRHPATSRGDAYLPELGSLDKGQQLELGSLSSVYLRELAQGSLGGQISWSLLQLLEQRSEGNPLFAEQLLRYFTENNMILRHTDGQFYLAARPGESIPTDVRALLIARLDRLTREVRNVVQTASILGREFEVRILKSMLKDTPDLPTKLSG